MGKSGRVAPNADLGMSIVCDLPLEQEDDVCVIPPANWPASGTIRVRNLCVRYQEDLPEVLKDIQIEIKASLPMNCTCVCLRDISQGGQRVAICGATGSGKSTFAMALFRAIESHQGSICIDGVGQSGQRVEEASAVTYTYLHIQTSNMSVYMICARA